jgi:flagellin-specific chaperone FliS
MFEKTLWEISNIQDNKTYEKELKEYLENMAEQFRSGEFNADLIVPVLTELVPSDLDRLKAMQKRLIEFFPEDPTKKPGYTDAKGAYAFTQLHTAVSNKLNILEGNTESIDKTIEDIKAAINEQKRIIASNIEDKAESKRDPQSGRFPEDILESKEKELKLLERGLKVTRDILNSSIGRLSILIASFHDLSVFVPTDMQSIIQKQSYSLNESLIELQKLTADEKDILEFRTHFDKANAKSYEIILMLVSSVNAQLQQVKNQISQAPYTRLNSEVTRLANYAPLLSAKIINLKTYQVMVDRFSKMYSQLTKEINKAPKSVEEFALRSNQEKALQHADNKIDPENFPYQISGAQVRSSKNKYYQDQLDYNAVAIANPTKFIVMGKLKDNLAGIKKDVERSLRINDIKVPEEIFKDADKLKQFLETELGKENAANLIRHYDQGIPMLISGGITASGGANEAGEIDFNPSSHTEKLYVENGVVYRDAAIENIKIFVPKDPNSDERWLFKTKVKILSMLTADGFEIVKVGTDNPLICNSILLESSHPDLKNMLDKIVEYEANLWEKKLKFEKDPESDKKLDLVNKALDKTGEFKKGAITFDELTKGIRELSDVPVKHLSVTGKALSLFGTPPGITKTLNEFAASLEKVKKNIDDKAVKYNVGVQDSPKSSPSSLSLNRS